MESQLSQSWIDTMRADGHWPDRLLTEYLDEAARDVPDQVAIVDTNSMTERSTILT